MANSKDGKNGNHQLPVGTYMDYIPQENNLGSSGNSDSKILAKVFEELSKDGLRIQEREKIEAFDELLKDADIIINKTGTMATIAQENGKTFTVKAPTGKSK